jgi:peptidyl-tRNA hydrolase, PTH1 family
VKIIVSLGNPGLQYNGTRHNVGLEVLKYLRKKYLPNRVIKRNYYRAWESEVEGETVLLVKPKVFVNESGIAVEKIFETFDAKLQDMILIHDDLDLPVGKIKIIFGKGPGGHNGVISVIEHVQSKDFIRVRIGIGRERIAGAYTQYVLSPFLPEEKKEVKESVEKAAAACEVIIKKGYEKAMTDFN